MPKRFRLMMSVRATTTHDLNQTPDFRMLAPADCFNADCAIGKVKLTFVPLTPSSLSSILNVPRWDFMIFLQSERPKPSPPSSVGYKVLSKWSSLRYAG